MEKKKFTCEVGGKEFIAEFSPLASQSSGSVMIRFGESVVMVNAVMSRKPKPGAGWFPLTVDFEEKYYAEGRIPAIRFTRREARPSVQAILTGRFIDRTIRPLFDGRMRYDIQVVATTLSHDEDNTVDMAAMLGASIALHTSDIPWNGPVSTVRVIKSAKGEFIINPDLIDLEEAQFEIIASGKDGNISMLEGRSDGADEAEVLEAIKQASKAIEKLNAFQEEIRKEMGKEKRVPVIYDEIPEVRELFEKEFRAMTEEVFAEVRPGKSFYAAADAAHDAWTAKATELFPDAHKDFIEDIFEEALDGVAHTAALKQDKRADGRAMNEVRPLEAEAGLLPRTHGSGVFFRGDTHILSIVTLGAPGENLLLDGLGQKDQSQNFIHHYNFPPFSVGETGRIGNPGRREIGHGALAEKALEAIIPTQEDFPYMIRVVSETMSSNGSSSMGSVSAGCLALMDAGVPIKAPVAGIAMGLMSDAEGNYKILTDIQGPEDHYGDMDLKVAGTEDKITAIQMDIKVEGVTFAMLKDAFADALAARKTVLKTITAELSESRKELSKYAPRVETMKIPVDKIGELIGPGGKNINEIIEDTGAEISVEQDGTVFIVTPSADTMEAARKRVALVTQDFEVGEIVEGEVSRLFEFGAMIEFAPGKEGMVHISEISPERTEKVTDKLNIGDRAKAKIIKVDEKGRVNLSIKAVTHPESYNENSGYKGSSDRKPYHKASGDRGNFNKH